MNPLPPDKLRNAHDHFQELKRGEPLTAEAMREWIAFWEPVVQPDAKDRREQFAVTRTDGTTTGVTGPRWIFHLLGLRHRAVHVGFATPTGLIVLQRRSATLRDWPNAADMAVAGHVPQAEDGRDLSYLQGAWKEIEEEVGLLEKEASETLAEGVLLPVGAPYLSLDRDLSRNPPFYNAECRQVYAATLTAEGLARLHFADNEVSGLLLVTPETAWDILVQEFIASGLRYSLPRYLDWLEKQK